LLNRFALALDAKHPASQGLIETALRAMDPNAGRDEKDAAARTLRCRKILGDMFKGEQLAVQIPRSGVDKMTEKIVRGLVYREDGRFIETPYEVSTYVDGAEADFAREMIQKAGKEYKREPGLEIRRATVDSDPRTAIYEITFWKQFKTYATVGYDCPPGNHLLDRSEAVTAGDLWCHRGKVHRIWLPAKLFGKQLPNNDYCRKAF
jgi:hypothetical protein